MMAAAGLVVMRRRIDGERGDVFGGVAEGAGGGFFPEAEGVEFGGGIDDGVFVGGGLLGLGWEDNSGRQCEQGADVKNN